MPFLFDGYNLLRAIQKSDEEFESLIESGLCRILSEYLKRVRDRGHIFFDGIGPPDKTRLGDLDNLEVYFTGQHTDADTAIEEKIADSTAPKSLIIVSSDRRLLAAGKKRKAVVVKSELFWPEMTRRLENHKKPTPEPRAKREGITKTETDHWLDIFGLKE